MLIENSKNLSLNKCMIITGDHPQRIAVCEFTNKYLRA